MKINHGLHGLNGFSKMDLAAKAADFTDSNPHQLATKFPNPQ